MKYNIAILFIILCAFWSCKKKGIDSKEITPPEKNYLSKLWVNYQVAKLQYSKENESLIANAKKLNAQAFSLYKSKKDKEAVEIYEKSIDSYPLGETYYNYGNSLSNISRLEDSILAYEVALHLEAPRTELVLYNTACSHSRLNQTQQAYTYLAQAVDRGYNAIVYIQKDPDMENLRKDPEWESKIQALLNPKDYSKEELVGRLKIGYIPRGADDYILCSTGVAISPINPWEGMGGVCPDSSAYENAGFMYKIGNWKLDNGDLKIHYIKECKPEIIEKLVPDGDFSTMGCEGMAGIPKFRQCSNSISSGRSNVTISKNKVLDILSSEKLDPEVSYELNGNISEPKQCDPNFVPKTLDDLKLE